MKFLISIIMVLLTVNLFTQAEEGVKTNVVPKADPPSSTALPVDNALTINTVSSEVSYQDTMRGGHFMPENPAQDVGQGNQATCSKTDALGRCVPMPNDSNISNSQGTLTPGNEGENAPAESQVPQTK